MHTFLHSSHSPSQPLHRERQTGEATSSRESAFSSGLSHRLFLHFAPPTLTVIQQCRVPVTVWNRYRPESLAASLVLLLFIPRARARARSRVGLLECTNVRAICDDARDADCVWQFLGTPYHSDNLIYENRSKCHRKYSKGFEWFAYDLSIELLNARASDNLPRLTIDPFIINLRNRVKKRVKYFWGLKNMYLKKILILIILSSL